MLGDGLTKLVVVEDGGITVDADEFGGGPGRGAGDEVLNEPSLGGARLRRPGLHRSQAGRDGEGARDAAGGGQAYRGEAGVRAVTEAVGGRAVVRVGAAVPALGEGLRAVAGDGGGVALAGVRVPDAAGGD